MTGTEFDPSLTPSIAEVRACPFVQVTFTFVVPQCVMSQLGCVLANGSSLPDS